ncbi:J domain-containing protein [Mycena chlorophos]|uniref:J domain-containing protein n=1 Tax=Mycena chlorophos TaxID=658473 RepID=A0A8H6RYX1_MYCCL|nr:J domain-containing protein [Mycena chlorophos]
MNLVNLTATEILSCSTATTEQLVTALLLRIAQSDVQAWVHVDQNLLLSQAHKLDGLSRDKRQALHGVPVGVKDIFYTEGMPTQHNSPLYKSAAPAIDAAIVSVLKSAGALVLGKTTTTEFASVLTGPTPPTRNAHDATRTPGGSSSGSAAAVAALQVPIALGTQTIGSIIRPASFNGIFGFKPTWGAISREGVKVCSINLDTIGFFTRSVADLDLLADVVQLRDDNPPGLFRVAGATIGMCRTHMWDRAGPGTKSAMELGKRLLQDSGAIVEDVELPSEFESVTRFHTHIFRSDAKSAFLNEWIRGKDGLDPTLVEMVENPNVSHREYLAALDGLAQLRREFDGIASKFDVICAPSVVDEAPVGLSNTGDSIMCGIWTALHVPVVNVPGLSSSRGFSTTIPAKYTPRILLNALLFASSLHAGKTVLGFEVGVFWITMRVLACGGFGVLVWEGWTGQLAKRKSIEWSVLGTASLLVFVQQACLFTAVALFSHFASLWLESLWTTSAPRKAMTVVLAWLLCIISDTHLSSANVWRFLPGYGALLCHALSSTALNHTFGVLSPSLGTTFTISASAFGACVFALPFYLFRTVLLDFPSTPALPLTSLLALPFLAFTLLILSPITARSLNQLSFTPQHFALSYPTTAASAAILGSLAFSQFPTWTDFAVAVLLYIGMQPERTDAFPAAPRTPTSRLIRSYLKTILSNPESRKIFYFLMLNMAYMLVQMLYGVWTNSLGLISDAIHMAFDCMAIGVGLFASVMATWEPNERFTYGYGRIETLSGFANGIFLILISIFIVFEAIQRILEPPEMNTSQLLLVSSLGLAVNLFGMVTRIRMAAGIRMDMTMRLRRKAMAILMEATGIVMLKAMNIATLNIVAHARTNMTMTTGMITLTVMRTKMAMATHTLIPQRRPQRHIPTVTGAALHVHPHTPHLQDIATPITPNYRFGVDEHYQTHHEHEHVPNLHNPAQTPSHEGHSHNMRGVFLHVMADTLGSVGVIISTLLIQFYGWTGFDPIASLFIAVLIAASVIPLVIDTGRVLCLDVSDRDATIETALAELKSIEGVASFSAPRFWPKDATTMIGSIHIQLAASAASFDPAGPHSNKRKTFVQLDRVVDRVDGLLRGRISGLEELTIQVED